LSNIKISKETNLFYVLAELWRREINTMEMEGGEVQDAREGMTVVLEPPSWALAPDARETEN